MDDLVNIFKDTKADFVFLGFERWLPVPASLENINPKILGAFIDATGFSKNHVKSLIKKSGYSYGQLRDSIVSIKKEIPNIIIVGGIYAQKVNMIEQNDITGKIYDSQATQNMALDPKKFRVDSSKEQIQQKLKKFFCLKSADYPDITNPNFQELLLSWAEKQIDEGVDAIWIDALFSQVRVFEKITGDANNPAVKESYDAASKIVKE